ncbi:hypothetical protein ACIA8K_07385 [Catenuloplanes sp. NPDC051500]|uniref:hypothetical protein n=1 Tax=Catenuloplanes sp. NPDC051500 TaxID=3363959 RepID=UPI0037A47D81
MAFRRSKHRGTADSGDTAVLAKVPADTSGLAAELAAAAPQRYWNRWTIYLAGVLLVAGGVMAGVQIQQRWGSTATSATGFPGGMQGGFEGGGRGMQGAGGVPATAQAQPSGGSATEGTVKLVNGTTIYIVTSDGRTITVKTSDGTTVKVATDGTLSDLAEGDTVTVDGAVADDNSVTATAITEK